MHRYQIERLLGEGGMGRVYAAVDRRTGRRVAVKTLRPNLVDAAAQRLLLNEATAAARVRHRGFVELLDLQRDERGVPYLVMELVDGEDVSSWVSSWPGWGVVAPTLHKVADALAAAHAAGVIHGDLKPANVMLTRDGAVKIIDLGIARVLDPMRVRAAGSGVAGTPTYMPPEQFEVGAFVGPWTDLYAFGAMLAELVGGRSPFEASTVTQLLLAKVGELRLEARPGLAVPEELFALVRALLRREPRRRPRFAAEVRDAIGRLAGRVRDDVPVGAAPHTAGHPLHATALAMTEASASQPTFRDAGAERTSTDEIALGSGLTGGAVLDAPASVGVLARGPTPLVGREEEIGLLEDMMRQTCAEGGVRALVLCGPSGAGKSRLARHGLALAELRGQMEGLVAAYDPSRPYGAQALADAFRAVLGTSPDQWAGVAPTEGPLADHLAHWLGSREREPMAPEVTVEIGHAALVHVAAERPVYLWLDDVDAARDGAVELASALLSRLEARVLLVATARGTKDELARSRAGGLGAHPSSLVLELGPLEPRARRELVRTFAPLAPPILEELARIADDTPLLVMHRVRDWESAGLLDETPEGLAPRPPATVASLVADHPLERVLERRVGATLAVLGERAGAARLAGAHMALLGTRFEEAVLRASVGHDALVDDLLDVMLLEGLVVAERGGVYRFDHALIRAAFLAPLAASPDAANVRREVARALESTHGGGRIDVGVHVAALLREAGDPAAWPKLTDAAQGYLRAGFFDAASELGALAEEWLEADRVPDADERRGDLELLRAHGAYFHLDYAAARSFAGRALEIYASLPMTDPLALKVARARHRVATIHFYEDEFRAAEDIALELVALAERKGGGWGFIGGNAHHVLAQIAALRGDFDAAEEHELGVLRIAESGRESWRRVLAQIALGEVKLARGDVEGARRLITAAGQERSAGSEHVEGEVSDALIRVDVASGRFAHARAALGARLAELERRRDPWRLTALLALAAAVSAALDALDEALAATKRFVTAYRAVPHDERTTWRTMDQLAAILDARGARDAAGAVRAALEKRRRAIAAGLG